MANEHSLQEQIGRADESSWPKMHDRSAGTRINTVLTKPASTDKTGKLIVAAVSGSPYLERLITRNSTYVAQILSVAPTETLRDLLSETYSSPAEVDDAKAHLRRIKDKVMILLSLCDLAGIWSDLEVMEALSSFADAAVMVAFETAVKSVSGVRSGEILNSCGFVILGMGKHGARELNYSSDIDLVVFYDPHILDSFVSTENGQTHAIDPRQMAIRATKLAVSILQDTTENGYVFRTDLRLRPDPGTSNIAVTISAAERYYESYGQNWERAAFSKARVIAGHRETVAQVTDFLRPFIWRKYLDFAAIEDIHSIKRQIHAVKGIGAINFPGHDVKLGRGGIREIEFFVQTQQLILGGRNSALRDRTTLGGLQALANAGHIKSQTEQELREAYLLLRHIEHRIQMVNDEQSHCIPTQPDHITRLARLSGYDEKSTFEKEITKTLRLVHDHYADLFEESDNLSTESGSLVFTGVEDHPDTLDTLCEMGFGDASLVAATIRNWHAGGMRATKSPRARALLTKLVPVILRSLARTDDPQQGFGSFDALLRQMPGGVQFFSLVLNNPHILDKLIKLANLSPRLAREMATHSHLIETMLSSDFLEEEAAAAEAISNVAEHETSTSFEETLNLLRRRCREQRFQVSSQLLLTGTEMRLAARQYTRLAEHAIRHSLKPAKDELVRSHGVLDGALAVIGMGRLGASALTATSDLDLIFVYDTPANSQSVHEQPLDGVTWFARYVRRLLTVLSAQTEEGGLYEVDMALRPSGNAGPTAVSLSAFRGYYARNAWTWEEMALVKARVVAGEPELAAKISDEISNILIRKRDTDKVKADVLDMRRRLLRDKPALGELDLKFVRGGLTDIDFICQYLSLVCAHEHGRFPRHIADALPVFSARGVMSAEDARTLFDAWRSYETLMQLSRAAVGNGDKSGDLQRPLRRTIAARLGLSDPMEILPHLAYHRERVHTLFERFVGTL